MKFRIIKLSASNLGVKKTFLTNLCTVLNLLKVRMSDCCYLYYYYPSLEINSYHSSFCQQSYLRTTCLDLDWCLLPHLPKTLHCRFQTLKIYKNRFLSVQGLGNDQMILRFLLDFLFDTIILYLFVSPQCHC